MLRNSSELLTKCKEVSTHIRKEIVKMHARSKSPHIGSALSVVDILTVLYFYILKIDPKNPQDKNRDRFILSKGHAGSALYATLASRGFFPEEILDEYCMDGGKLPGHSTMHCVPGIEASTGSLGHGLSMGIGMALSAIYDGLNYNVFVLLSDGECDEGSVWEAAMFAAHHRLSNLIAIIDYNKLQAFGRTNEVVNLEPFRDKWMSFGWSTKEMDGHNFEEIINVLGKLPFEKDKPSAIIAHTTKGKGVSFMENQVAWHYKSPNEKELEIALKELESLCEQRL